MAKMKVKSAVHFLGFCIFYGLSRPLLLLPLKVLYIFSDIMFLFAYYVPGYRKSLVLNNIRNAFPEKINGEVKKIARDYYRHMCDSVIESFAASVIKEKELAKRCVWKNTEMLDDYFNRGKSIVAVFGHYGNWELLFSLPLYTRYQVLALYKPLSNIYFDNYMKNLRQRFGIKAVPVIRSYQAMLQHQDENIPTITLFLGDQRPIKNHIRYWTQFLNQDTPVMLGAEQLARRLNQVVVYFLINKVKRGYYEVEVITVTEEPESIPMYGITERHIRLLESQIIDRPEYWLWSHNRWKHKKSIRHQ